MYIVQNVGRTSVDIPELKISLKPNQKIDLDMICSRFTSEQSGALRHFISKGSLRIVIKDSPNTPFSFSENKTTASPVVDNKEILKKIEESEKRIKEQNEALIRKHLGKKAEIDEDSKKSLETAIKALQSLIPGLSLGNNTVKQESNDEIETEKTVDIHKRVIDRISKNTSGKIKTDDTKNSNNLDDKINELDDML